MILTKVEPEGINSIDSDGWEEIELAVDSGATENVVGEGFLQWVDIKEGIAAKRGVAYQVANGTKIPNLGEKCFRGVTEEGIKRNLTMQVCDVQMGLLSVSKIVASNHRVVFDGPDDSYIEDKQSKEKLG